VGEEGEAGHVEHVAVGRVDEAEHAACGAGGGAVVQQRRSQCRAQHAAALVAPGLRLSLARAKPAQRELGGLADAWS